MTPDAAAAHFTSKFYGQILRLSERRRKKKFTAEPLHRGIIIKQKTITYQWCYTGKNYV